MPGARLTFGKRNAMPAYKPELATRQRSPWLTWGVGGALALVTSTAGLTLLPRDTVEAQSMTQVATTPAAAGPFSLNGIWAPDGQSCGETRSFVEMKDGQASIVASIGRIEAFRYTVSGGNPLLLTTADGSTVLWDTADPDLLLPISFEPDKPGRAKSMTFRRCSEADI